MTVKTISPLLHQALIAGHRPRFFATVDLDVLNKQVDSQADWQACTVQTNADMTSSPGSAQIEIDLAGYVIENTSDNTDLDLFISAGTPNFFRVAWQGFTLDTPRPLTEINLKFDATGAGAANEVHVLVVSALTHLSGSDGTFTQTYTVHGSVAISIADAFSGVKTATVSPAINLEAGQYWLMIYPRQPYTLKIRYQNTDVLSGGSLEYQSATSNVTPLEIQAMSGAYTAVTGDLYCRLEFGAYSPSAIITTKVLDLGQTPVDPGVFQMAYALPEGTSLVANLSGSASYDMSTPTTYSGIADGDALAAFRFWQATLFLYTNADLDQTPRIDLLEVMFPNGRISFREADDKLVHAHQEILDSYHPILKSADFTQSELKIIERVASGGSATLTLEDRKPDIIHRMVADYPLKNHRISFYIGADVPGLRISDLCRFFIGIIEDVKEKPKYRGETYGLTITAKNPVLELKRKAPAATAAGPLVVGDTNIDHDGIHVVDSMLDIIRAKASIPARYVDLGGFEDARADIGDTGLASSVYRIRRSDTAGLADTRIKTPEEINKHLAPLATIVDGYIVEDEASRITLVIHDTTATAEAIWADEDMVREGEVDASAIPIEHVDSFPQGYADLLFNMCYTGAVWDASGSDWAGFGKIFAEVNSDSANDFGMGEAVFLSLMEKNMKEVSKWLGPESGYNGETLAQAIAARMTARFGYPPVRMVGAVLPVSQFMRTLGSVIQVHSRELVRYGRRGISPSETVKFMITKKKYDEGRNKMIFDLMELT